MDTLIGYGIVIFVLIKVVPAMSDFIFDVIGSAVKSMAVIFVMAMLSIVILRIVIGV